MTDSTIYVILLRLFGKVERCQTDRRNRMPTQDYERAGKSDSAEDAEVPVLIAGGGPIGLSMSLLLSHHGIGSLLVEQHPGTSIYPKARLINARTMEIFRQIGIEQAIREVAIPHAR